MHVEIKVCYFENILKLAEKSNQVPPRAVVVFMTSKEGGEENTRYLSMLKLANFHLYSSFLLNKYA